jgi:uncharacterized repeat protein (TIGR01451 family)
VQLRGQIAQSATGSVDNSATVSSSTLDPNAANNSATARTQIDTTVPPPEKPAADLTVTLRVDRSTAQVGEIVSYTVVTANNGPGPAPNAVLRDSGASSLTNVTYSDNGGASWQSWPGSLSLGNMASGETRTVILRGQVAQSAAGSIQYNVTVSSDATDSVTADNSGAATITVTSPPDPPTVPAGNAQLEIHKTVYPRVTQPRGCVYFTLDITNTGSADATDATLSERTSHDVCELQYSLDGGISWQCWGGSLYLGTIRPYSSVNVILRGIISRCAVCPVVSDTGLIYTGADKETVTLCATCAAPVERCRLFQF